MRQQVINLCYRSLSPAQAERVCDDLGLIPTQAGSLFFAQLVKLGALPFRPSTFPALDEYGATASRITHHASRITSVIAYYLQHSRAVEDYLRAQAQAAAEVRREVESRVDTQGLRERLRQRRTQATA